ncbi:MAG: copper homeostasis periplasmic binding protein CopC [Sandarakinorhabdus sp.]|nr:copper homeostasis periplasmic binding protein CopC [Sandarakinorhabdus sp.]
MALGSAAQAHPRLLAATPAANETIASTKALKLTFSEALIAQFSGMSVLMTDMPGMKMSAPMSVGAVTSKVETDGKTLVGTLPTPLPTGTYTLGWHAVTADTHRVEGSYSFKVK